MSSTSTAFRRLATWPSAAALLDAAVAAATLAGSLTLLAHGDLRDPPRRVELRHPSPGRGAGPGRCGAGGVLDGAPDRLAALPLGVFAVTAASGVLLAGLGYRMDLLLGSSAALYLLAASRQPPTPWTWRTTVTVVGLLLAYLGAAAAAQQTFPQASCCTPGWPGRWPGSPASEPACGGEQVAELSDRAVRAEREAERAAAGRRHRAHPDRPRPPRLRRPRDQRDRRARRRGPAAAPPGPRSLAARFGGDRGAGTADGRGARSAGRHPARGRLGQRRVEAPPGLGRWTP